MVKICIAENRLGVQPLHKIQVTEDLISSHISLSIHIGLKAKLENLVSCLIHL